jgi:hypothetical protein
MRNTAKGDESKSIEGYTTHKNKKERRVNFFSINKINMAKT